MTAMKQIKSQISPTKYACLDFLIFAYPKYRPITYNVVSVPPCNIVEIIPSLLSTPYILIIETIIESEACDDTGLKTPCNIISFGIKFKDIKSDNIPLLLKTLTQTYITNKYGNNPIPSLIDSLHPSIKESYALLRLNKEYNNTIKIKKIVIK